MFANKHIRPICGRSAPDGANSLFLFLPNVHDNFFYSTIFCHTVVAYDIGALARSPLLSIGSAASSGCLHCGSGAHTEALRYRSLWTRRFAACNVHTHTIENVSSRCTLHSPATSHSVEKKRKNFFGSTPFSLQAHCLRFRLAASVRICSGPR